jgi:hypothetical protein
LVTNRRAIAKAKGVPKEWQPEARKKRSLWRAAVSLLTVVHLWTAAMDSLGNWMRARSLQGEAQIDGRPPASIRSMPESHLLLECEDPESDTSEWEVPDLKEGSVWCKARIHSLCQAIQDLPNREQHFEDDLQALARHGLNYTLEGPQQLQLLWWKFPEEHWEPLREGCSMNFLVLPGGESQMNSKMDEAIKAEAGRFVDELVKLGVLLPAIGKLRAN